MIRCHETNRQANAATRDDADFWIACRTIVGNAGVHLESERGRAMISLVEDWAERQSSSNGSLAAKARGLIGRQGDLDWERMKSMLEG